MLLLLLIIWFGLGVLGTPLMLARYIQTKDKLPGDITPVAFKLALMFSTLLCIIWCPNWIKVFKAVVGNNPYKT